MNEEEYDRWLAEVARRGSLAAEAESRGGVAPVTSFAAEQTPGADSPLPRHELAGSG